MKPETPASGSAGSSGAKPDATSGAKPGAAPGATRVTEAASLTDGPILDLKAKRLSDAADAAKPGAKPDAGKESAGASASAKDAAKETPKDTAKAAPARGGAGFGSVAASGLIGGLIGAGLLYGVTTYQRGADPRLANLDKSLASLATKDSVAGLDKRLAANEQALKPLPDAVARAETAAKAAADRANEALQKAGVAPATAPSADGSAPAPAVPADIAARLDALDQRVSALQEEPGRDGTAEVKTAQTMDPAALAALDDRLKALETNGGKSAASDLSDKIAALQADVASRAKADEAAEAALGKRVDEVQKALDGRIAAATQTVQEATQASKQAADAAQTRADEAVKGLERKLQEQSERIAGLDKAVDQSAKQSTVQSALRIVAADRIASALEAGQPYPDALASLRNLEPADSKRLDALGPFADKGAPTASGLAAEFRRISEKIAEAKRAAQAKSVAETGSVGDRLMNMASSLVQVKRADGPTAGGTQAAGSSASTAQVQAALDRGDLAEAAKAYATLPEEARAQGGDFGTRLSARAEAGRAAQALLADAFTGLPPAR
ncbi:COG4223 family protein [Methylorubrum sp. SL192]|uniref:COG4223 family protein n=1 Tax=Methylorubrum sp. SL192 TaxID=2995167 RepID=UPI002275EE14|nr:hypothetical protein [Methylorubrum sp. SL192]MCY1645299.1 hypothetical protein [Methylorubrum sp. SL192]